jgi:DNA invertase Pin-like site-specific DNA recombinase
MKKCFAYLRVSDSSQVAGDGYTRQLKACTDYAAAHGMTIAGIYREDISGTEFARPTLAQLMVTLEFNGHAVKTVLVEKLDRLARDLLVQEAILRDFKTKGFDLVSTCEGADLLSDDPTRKLVRQMFGAIAEYEKRMIVLKLKASRDRMRQHTGKCEGRKGYRDTPKGQELIKQVKLLHRRSKYGQRTHREVADELNAKGICTFDHAKWTPNLVRKVLSK